MALVRDLAVYFSEARWHYVAAAIAFTITLLVLLVLRRAFKSYYLKRHRQEESTLPEVIIRIVSQLYTVSLVAVALFHAISYLPLPPSIRKLIVFVLLAMLVVQTLVIAGHLLAAFLPRVLFRGHGREPAKHNAVVNIILLLKAALWVSGFLFLLDNLGFNITSMVAGLGIGGIAIALASQAILGDTFNSFAIYLDAPFEIGDFIVVDEFMGTIEAIGLKTTRIRSLGGELLIFSNSDLTAARIRNYKRMQTRRVVFKIGVVYSTPLELLRAIPGLLRGSVEETPKTRFDRAHFLAYGESALEYEVVYYVLSPDYNAYMDIQQEINLKIREKFDAHGVECAFPSRTLYLQRAARADREEPGSPEARSRPDGPSRAKPRRANGR